MKISNISKEYIQKGMYYACSNGNYNTIKLLVENGAEIGITHFTVVCRSGDKKSFEYCLEWIKKNSPDIKPLRNGKAFIHACQGNNIDIIRYFYNI